jgi:hypothetical protein
MRDFAEQLIYLAVPHKMELLTSYLLKIEKGYKVKVNILELLRQFTLIAISLPGEMVSAFHVF